MQNLNVFILVDYILNFLGIYIIYCGIRGKKEGRLSPMFLPPNVRVSDMEGLVKYTFPRIIAFGAICIVYGTFGFVIDTYFKDASRIITGVSTLLFLIAYVWFSMMLRKAREKFI